MEETEIRVYQPGKCIAFRKTNEMWGGLSNMAPGFPIEVNNIQIRTSEVLYQACRWPHRPDIQRMLLGERSPMTAKMKSKPFRKDSRADWDDVRVRIMMWCLRVKLAQNFETFGGLLASTGESDLVEVSSRDDFWGAKPFENGLYRGVNALGRLLMKLRYELVSEEYDFSIVRPANVENFKLLGSDIGEVRLKPGHLPPQSVQIRIRY